MKKGVTINFSLTNRWLYTLIAFLVLAIVGVGVYATSHPNPGHSLSEIDLPTCSSGQVLGFVGGNWICKNDVNNWRPAPTCSGSQKLTFDGTNLICSNDINTNTNANTACSGTYTYLNGDGACRNVRTDARCTVSSGSCGGDSCTPRWMTVICPGSSGSITCDNGCPGQ